MGRLDDLDMLAGLAVAVARDDEAFERMRPAILDGARHGSTCLAGADYHGSPPRWFERIDIGSEAGSRSGGGESGVEQIAQQSAGIGIFHLRNLRTIGARC